jgi:TRAP-type uncharacterized transport system substrate-binding protein
MLGFDRWHLLKGSAAILCVVGIASLVLIYFFPAPPSTITIAVGFKGLSYELLANRYKEILARDHVNLVLRNTVGGAEHFKLLEDKNSGVQVAMVQGGISNDEKSPGLLSLGRINYQIFCIFYRANEVLNDLTELKGKRIAVGPVGLGGRTVAEKVLAISGVTSENSTLLPLTGQAAANALNDGNADAAILGLSSDAPILQALLRDSRIRIMSVTDAEALTRIVPFLVRLILPRGAIDYEKKIPASDVVLFATTNAVLIRSDLHPSQISLLAQALKETHRKRELFQQAGEFPTLTDPEFPMAEGAVEFYKNGLPLLDKYLPTGSFLTFRDYSQHCWRAAQSLFRSSALHQDYSDLSWDIVWAPCTADSGPSKQDCNNALPPLRCRRLKPSWRVSIDRSICSASQCSTLTCFSQ